MAETVTLFNSRRSPADEEARLRQDATDSLHRALTGAVDGARNIPIFLAEVFEREAWKYERIFAGGSRQLPISFHEYVHSPYPVGLGQQNYDVIRAFISRDTNLLALYDRASQRNSGNPTGRNQFSDGAEDDAGTLYNVQHSVAPAAPAGNTKQAGLRRLEKAANDDPKARELFERALKGETSVNAACIEMGWRKKLPALDAAKAAVKKLNAEEREELRAWMDDFDSPMRGSRFQ